MFAGELSKDYYENVVLNQVEKLQKMMISFRDKQTEIFKKLTVL